MSDAFPNVLMLSFDVNECKPLVEGPRGGGTRAAVCGGGGGRDEHGRVDAATLRRRARARGRGLPSSTFQLNLSRFDHTSRCPAV